MLRRLIERFKAPRRTEWVTRGRYPAGTPKSPSFCSCPLQSPSFHPGPQITHADSGGAVKEGPVSGPPAGHVLDGREHGGRLEVRQGRCNNINYG